MLQRILQVILILVCITLQIVFGQWFGYGAPELVLACVMAVSLAGDVPEAIMWSALGGVLLDMLLGAMPGFYLVTFGIISILLVSITRQVLHRPSWTVALVIFFILGLMVNVAMGSLTGTLTWWLVLPSGTTAAVATLIYFYFSVIAKRQEVIQLG